MINKTIIGLQTGLTGNPRYFRFTSRVRYALLAYSIFIITGILSLAFSLTVWSYQICTFNFFRSENITLRKELDSFISGHEHFARSIQEINISESDMRVSFGVKSGEQIEYAMGGRQNPSDRFLQLVNPINRKFQQLNHLQEYVDHSITFMEKRLSQLNAFIQYKKNIWSHTPVIAPAIGPFTSGFGDRIHPITGQERFHYGLDISGPIWTEIYASADGTVTKTYSSKSFGNIVVIDHGNGFTTKYAHLEKIMVEPGQIVKRYNLIGYMGDTGSSTGNHLHYEVHRDGSPKNPKDFILPTSELVD